MTNRIIPYLIIDAFSVVITFAIGCIIGLPISGIAIAAAFTLGIGVTDSIRRARRRQMEALR